MTAPALRRYVPHMLSDRIGAEHDDYGGEGIAHRDTTTTHPEGALGSDGGTSRSFGESARCRVGCGGGVTASLRNGQPRRPLRSHSPESNPYSGTPILIEAEAGSVTMQIPNRGVGTASS
ncbi:MAG: hypothetical protein ABFC38_02450 [Methanospirillum sp.]